MLGSFAEKTAPIMEALSSIFQSFPRLALYYTTVVRFVFVVLAVFIVGRAVISLLRAKTPPEIWGYLSLPGSHFVPILHWENVVGRDKSVDLHVDLMTVSRNHGTLVRNSRGDWYYSDLDSKSGSKVNGKTVNGPTLVRMGDTLTIGGVDCTLMPPSLAEKQRNVMMREKHSTRFTPWASLIALSIFQLLTCIQLIAAKGAELPFMVILAFLLFGASMWIYCSLLRSQGQVCFEMETIFFSLCTLNLAIVATSDAAGITTELLAIFLGMGLFIIMCWYLRDLRRSLAVRRILVIGSIILLLINIVFGSASFGAVNWVSIGSYMLQPSELVKIAFIFIGSATLDELYEKKNLTLFVGFSIFCLGALAVMNDFGTAAIFFVTFLIISYLRSGQFGALVLVGGVSAAGALLMIRLIPHVTQRFSSGLHAWDFPDAGGFQQVRGMSAAASGGCFGLGAGNGWFHSIFAADTDLVFPLISEEWGLFIALLAVFSLVALGLFAVRSINFGRSTFFTIAACAATSLIIFQSCMNVLGSLDIFPFTGVTLPFLSNGGTSMLTSWGLLAFLKAADTRQNASLAVKSVSDDPDEIFEAADNDEGDYYARHGRARETSDNYSEVFTETHQYAGKRSKRSRSKLSEDVVEDVVDWLDLEADTPARKRRARHARSAKNNPKGGADR
jgi:cell division protein FtsW (lipid II flippase)